jgi:GT2 family glycosyltransferase
MMNRESISVAVVNYNGEVFIKACLDSVLSQSLPPSEIVVVDNGSTDGSAEIIRTEYPSVNLIRSESNEFFARGANRSIAATAGSLVLLLNNDAVLAPDYLEEAVKPLARDERIGSVTGKILRAGGETLDTTGQFLSRSRKPLERGYGEQDDGRYDEEEEIFGAGGVAPLLRRSMLEAIAVGGEVFDEDFVQYYEDLDLFWRARNFGWKAWYAPKAVAYHHRGGVGQSEPAAQGWVRQYALANLPTELQAHLLKNRYATMVKNDRLGSWLLGSPWILLYELKILAYLLLIKPAMIPKYLRSFGFLGTALRKRRELKREARRRGVKRYGGMHNIRAKK